MLGQGAGAGEVDAETRLFDRIRILLEEAEVLNYAVDGFARGQLSREKPLHAASNEKGVFVLQVQTGQIVSIAAGKEGDIEEIRKRLLSDAEDDLTGLRRDYESFVVKIAALDEVL